MGKILILNGSPRAPKSNSKRYAEIVRPRLIIVTLPRRTMKNCVLRSAVIPMCCLLFRSMPILCQWAF